MGVIKRQSIKNSLVRYFGIVIGALNVLLFYPLFLGVERIGQISFVVDTALLASTFVLFGGSSVAIKFFPSFRDAAKRHHGFLTFLLLWVFCGFVLFLLGVLIFKPLIIDYFGQKPPEYLNLLPYVLPLVLLVALTSLLTRYINNFNRIVVPTLLEQLYKIVVPLLAFLFFYDRISFKWLMKGILFYYLVYAICLMLYLRYLDQWKISFDFSKFKKPVLKDIFTYAGYGVLGSIGGALAMKIDSVMVASLTDFSNAGIYKIALFIATVIRIPSTAITTIASPIISDNLAKGNIEEIGKIYKKSSIILWTIGILFLLGIWTNLDSLFQIMPDGATFAKGKMVVLVLGIGILFDLLTSINGEIISYSPYFRFNFYSLLILAVLNIIANLIFIPIYGIVGAAMATACSLILYNTVKLIFIYYKFRLLPVSIKTLYVLLIALGIYFLVCLFPSTQIPVLDILIKSCVICLLFIPAIIYFKISEDISSSIWEVIDRVKRLF